MPRFPEGSNLVVTALLLQPDERPDFSALSVPQVFISPWHLVLFLLAEEICTRTNV